MWTPCTKRSLPSFGPTSQRLGLLQSGCRAIASTRLSDLGIELLRIHSGSEPSLPLVVDVTLLAHQPIAVGEEGLIRVSAGRIGLRIAGIAKA